MTARAFPAIALCLLSQIVSAQSVRGKVVNRGDSVGVPGVVVQLVDSTGGVVGRALSNESGEYRLVAPSAGSYRLRTTRIGFRPTTSRVIQLRDGEETAEQIVLAGVVFSLDTVRVAERKVCQSSSDSSDAMAAMWEQVRTALIAAQLTARLRALTATVVTFDRTLDPNTRSIREQSFGLRSAFTVQPFASRTAEQLRRTGYVVSSDDFVMYYAPDLDVLLSASWLVDHCFRVTKSRDASLMGIAFEPTRDRARIPEIRGVLWLDRKTSELRSMEFQYTNILREQADWAGGDIEFARMRNGGWAISRWSIRMPLLQQELGGRPGVDNIKVTEVHEVGGELVLGLLGSDTLFARPPIVLSGVILDSISGKPVGGARITVTGTDLQGTSDQNGRFAISDMLPGQYTLEIRTPALDSVGARVQWPLSFTDPKAQAIYRLPSSRQIASARRAALSGLVVDSMQQPIAGADVVLPALGLRTTSDARGAFRIDSVPSGTHDVSVRHIGHAPLNAQITFAPRQLVERRIVLPKVTSLDTVAVTALGPIESFEENRRRGIGAFITRGDLERQRGRKMSEILEQLRGMRIVPASGGKAYVSSGRRSVVSLRPVNPPDDNRLVPDQSYCLAQVYVNDAIVYSGTPGEPVFDINSLSPDQIEAVEYYATPASTPLKYSRRSSECGVVVIHTRRSR